MGSILLSRRRLMGLLPAGAAFALFPALGRAGSFDDFFKAVRFDDVRVVKSLLQRGLGENARLVMTVHPILESRFFAALALIGQLGFMRSPPRAIRVIEEEFV